MNAPHTELARAKVNLALHVLGRRADSFHDLDSLVAFADIADRLSFEPSSRTELVVSGPFAACIPRDDSNLILRAVRMMEAHFAGCIPPLRIALEKNLPVAAGIGGGSADAAACLRALARLAGHGEDLTPLRPIANALGADVLVCIGSQASRMRGAGAELEIIANFPPHHAVLVNPGVSVKTSDVFAALALVPGEKAFAPIADQWSLDLLRNDLTSAAIRVALVIEDVLAELGRHSQIKLSRMSGSGATCFGLCTTADAARIAAGAIARDHPDWWVVPTVLS